jgi:hypothetical protein
MIPTATLPEASSPVEEHSSATISTTGGVATIEKVAVGRMANAKMDGA